jgi:N-acetyl-beta-hexosaminidase
MRQNTLFGILILGCALVIQSCSSSEQDITEYEAAIKVIPAPAVLQAEKGSFTLNTKTQILYSDPSLEIVARNLSKDIELQTSINLPVNREEISRNSKGILLLLEGDNPKLDNLPHTYGISPKDENPDNERYALTATKKNICISAKSAEGVFRGATTLRHFIKVNKSQDKKITIPALTVYDSPRFAWRGLSFDVSRHFFNVGEVKEIINMLALYKMNVLHLHLTDNEGWRIEIKGYPKLTEVGGFMDNKGRAGGYFTQEDYKEIVSYAAERFITIIPEIDLPGHSAAIFAAYPELKNAATGKTVMPGVKLLALDPDDEKAIALVETVITELAAITPGNYIHIGGDETFGMPENKFISFVDKIRPIVKNTGKKVIGWQETSRTAGESDDLIQYWIHLDMERMMGENSGVANMIPKEIREAFIETFKEAPKDIERAVAKDMKIVLSPAGYVYLDYPYAEESADPTQAKDAARLGLQIYPKITIKDRLNWDPSTLSNAMDWEKHSAGIEAAIWCETIESASDLHFLLLPRLSGVAEKGWTNGKNIDWDDYSGRLAEQSRFWENAGWNYFKSSLVDWK